MFCDRAKVTTTGWTGIDTLNSIMMCVAVVVIFMVIVEHLFIASDPSIGIRCEKMDHTVLMKEMLTHRRRGYNEFISDIKLFETYHVYLFFTRL